MLRAASSLLVGDSLPDLCVTNFSIVGFRDFVPEIYDERFELPNGTSAVRRLGGLETPSVTESLFVRTACDT